jgi:hypothetical protein
LDLYPVCNDLVAPGTLGGAGAHVVLARGVSPAARIIATQKLSAAVLDFGLGVSVDCLAICGFLTERGVPFLYAAYTLLEGAPDAPILQKPATPQRMIAAVADLIENTMPMPGVAS